MKGGRLITPFSLRDEMLEKIHGSHLGVGNCHSRARKGLFWPNVSKHNKEKVAICGVCNKYRNYQVKESLLPHRVPDRPWQVLAVDMFVPAQGKIVVLVNYY